MPVIRYLYSGANMLLKTFWKPMLCSDRTAGILIHENLVFVLLIHIYCIRTICKALKGWMVNESPCSWRHTDGEQTQNSALQYWEGGRRKRGCSVVKEPGDFLEEVNQVMSLPTSQAYSGFHHKVNPKSFRWSPATLALLLPACQAYTQGLYSHHLLCRNAFLQTPACLIP